MYYFLLLLSAMAVSFGAVLWGGLYGFLLLRVGLFGCFTTATWISRHKEVKDDKDQTL